MPFIQDWPTGSTYTNGHGADVDIVRFTEDPEGEKARLLADGFEFCGNDYGMDDSTFFSVRKGLLNYIVVWDYLTYIHWVAFSELAKTFGDMDKCHRVELSKALVEGNPVAAQNIVRTSGFHARAGQLSGVQYGLSYVREV